jgi:hypothetical protein
MCKRYRCTDKLIKHPKDVAEKFVSASAPFTHAWIPEKNRLILIILQCNTEHNVFWMFTQFVSASVPFTHAWTPEKKRLILYTEEIIYLYVVT